MTVTIVAHDMGGVGGMERQLQALIAQLLTRGISVEVVSRTLDAEPHPSLKWRRVRGPRRPFAIAYPWFALMASAMLLYRRGDIVHTTGAIVLNRADVCTVHYVHNGRGGRVQRARRDTRVYRLNAAVARTMSRLAENIAYSRSRFSRELVAVSEPIASELRDRYSARKSAIRVIENGVDTTRFRPDPRAYDAVRAELYLQDEPVALFVGSDWRGKGAEIAVTALAGAPSWNLIVLGNGDATNLLETARRLGVESRVRLVPETDQPERFYAAADVFVLPSAYESFSLAAFEAAASGLPVVATDVGAIGRIVDAGGGRFVERNPESVGAALTGLEASDLRADMGGRARASVEACDWTTIGDKYADLYRSIASLDHGSPIPSVG